MNQATYEHSRQQLLRRAALGEKNITALLDKLDSDKLAADKEQALAAQVAGARADLNREAAKIALQEQYDAAVAAFGDLKGKAGEAAAHVEALVAQARAALETWKQAQQAATAQMSTINHLAQQGARPVRMPAAFGGADYAVHLLRHAGVQYHQQILYTGLLPRIS